jgi:lipoprotein-releasing system permease protein
VADIDEERAYAHLSEARAALGERFGVSFIQIALADPSTAPAIARRLEAVTGHYAGAWQEREKVWLDVFRALRVSAAISLSSILVIAGVGMFSALAMIVMEKQREIAILRSSGFSRGDVAAVFFWQAMLLLVAGCLLGCAIAAAATWGLSNLPLRVRGIFSTDSFVVAWSPWHYFWAVLAATVAVLPAAVLPARRAARIEPAVILRGSGD